MSELQMIRWSGKTDKGKVRSNNEDAFLALRFDAQEVQLLGRQGDGNLNTQDFVFAVSDGMGGAKSGEFASRIAVDKITRLLPRSFRFRAQGLVAGFEDILSELVVSIHKDMMKLSAHYEECAGMGATLSFGWATPGHFFFAHVGDSRIYHLPKVGDLSQVTQDDTYVGWLRRKGEISEMEARRHPRRNVLTKSLGAGHQFVEPQLGLVICDPGDRFLLCSDGLIDGMPDTRLERMLREGEIEGMSDRLIAKSLDSSGRDNLTAVVLEVAGQIQPQPLGQERTDILANAFGDFNREA